MDQHWPTTAGAPPPAIFHMYNCFTATFGVFGHYIPGFESLNPVVLMSYHNNEE